MKKRFIIVPITALATLGLSSSVVLANNKVSLINDKVYIEEGADLDVDWDALRKASGSYNSVDSKNNHVTEDAAEPTATPDIQWTIRGQVFVFQGDTLTEEVLKLPSYIHLVNTPYVCNEDGTFDLTLLATNDSGTYGELIYNVVVYPRAETPTTVPTSSPTTIPSPTATVTSSPVPTSVAGTATPAPTLSPEDATLSMIQAGSKTVDIAYGSELTIASLGLDTSGRFEYEYDEDIFFETCNELGTFNTVVEVTDTTTNTKSTINVTINVKDMTKPTLKGVKKVIKIVGGKNVVARIKKGVSATDNVDGKIAKSKIKISGYKAKKYGKVQKVTFTVKDKAGNITKKTVKLKITNPVKKLNKTMYTKSVVNVRKTSSAKGKKLGTLKFGTKVKVIGQDRNTGWYKIKYKGGTGWVSNSYLSAKKLSKPVKKQNPSASDSKNTTPGSNLNADASNCACNCDCSDCTNLDTIVCASACDCVGSTNGGW